MRIWAHFIARLISSDATAVLLSAHAGHAEPHDVAILLGALACLVFGILRRRRIDVT